MLIKGEKYACEACVRGHRVTSCTHSERKLQHIAKKGRPVSQCTHCRTLRKSRAAHVKCGCGEKSHSKDGCTHEVESQTDNCCCSHGGRCSCSLKKEHLDPVPESDSDDASLNSAPIPEARRARAQTENGLTIFTNGHHKPVHKHNTMAHKCGLPYVVPRAHSIHGPSVAGLANRSVDNLPHTNTIDALHSESHIKDSIRSAQQEQRMVKSEHGSPHIAPISNLEPLNTALSPLDVSSFTDYNFLQNLDSFTSVPDHEPPLYSAGLTNDPIDWSLYHGLEFHNDEFTTSSYSQAASFTGFDFNGLERPPLTTTSTSGEQSEIEDFPNFDVAQLATRPSLLNVQYGSDFDTSDYGSGTGTYRLSTESSFLGHQVLEADNLDTLFKGSEIQGIFGNHGLPAVSYTGQTNKIMQNDFDENTFLPVTTEEDNDVFWMNNYASNNISINRPPEATYDENAWVQ